MLRMLPTLPMLSIEPELPMLRIEPALPMDKIEPALPMLKTLPKLMMLPTLPKLMMLNKLLALLRPAKLPVQARDSARFRRERADLCMVASSSFAASSLALLRSRQFSSALDRPGVLFRGVARLRRGLYHLCLV
jgi:hypothetical protein